MKPSELADAISDYARDQLERLVERHLRGFRVPGVFAGHPVGPDVRADLVFTLGMLRDLGVREVAGTAVEGAIERVLLGVDGASTHSFYSYRIAETLRRFGRFDDCALLEGGSPEARANLAEACDSSSWVKLLDRGVLPRNYAAVLARCELAREALGLPVETSLLDDLLERTRSMLTDEPDGYLDDSRSNAARYDIYTADVYLFTEPLAGRLGDAWEHGAQRALELVEAVCASNGAAISWGRSTGALATCLTLELGAMALARGLAADPGRWLGLAENAFRNFDDWLSEGLINAHQYRSTFAYRGPARRLQMTLDALGKLTYSALSLRECAASGIQACARADLFPEQDRFVRLSARRDAGVWAHRSKGMAFALPLVGATLSDYLPAPRNPGLFEVPVDADLPTGVPMMFHDGTRYAAGHVPRRVLHAPGRLEVEYEGHPKSGQLELPDDVSVLPGSRRAVFRVEGRTLHVEESLRFETLPDAVALQVAETRERPLVVRFESATPHATTTVDTAGLKEYRSFWAELPRVHQIDLEPAEEIELRWSVTPKLRVASTAHAHHYHRSLYDPLQDHVVDCQLPMHWIRRPARLRRFLRDIDLLHLHWPEWLAGPELELHREIIRCLDESAVRVVWTQHNAVPHRKDARYEQIYQAWAEASDGVIHHSEWGRDRMLGRFRYAPGAAHRVIRHGHFGNLMRGISARDRAAVEAALGLPPAGLRVGVVGAPRAEKRTQKLMDAVAACRRRDLQLVVFSLGEADRAPDDPRIATFPAGEVPRPEYNQRLASLDVLAIPIEGGDYLTTGQFADAVGMGIPTLITDWPFLHEALGGAGIPLGKDTADWTRTLDELDADTLETAAAASRALQASTDWTQIAAQTLELLETIGTAKL